MPTTTSTTTCNSTDQKDASKSPFAQIRKTLDYSYHPHPSPDRLVIQDRLISRKLNEASPSSRPLLLFTAGAMGAGKSHFLSTLPWEYILIDPDEIATTLPFFPQTTMPLTSFREGNSEREEETRERNKLERGSRLRHEARLVTEVLVKAAMQKNADIVLDGSLRSYRWYLSQIPALRAVYPRYRIELVHIHCPLEEVLRRAERRSKNTGRVVPRFLIERSWKDSRRAISVLGRKKIVDRVRMVDSSGKIPVVVYDSDLDDEWEWRGVPNEVSRVDGFLSDPHHEPVVDPEGDPSENKVGEETIGKGRTKGIRGDRQRVDEWQKAKL